MTGCSCTTWTWPGWAPSESLSISPCATARSPASGKSTTLPPCAKRASLTDDGYRHSMHVRAGRERVWDAVGTVDGPRHWWTTEVSGSAAAGGELRFGFAGLDEQIIMRVDSVQPPSEVRWSCTAHTRNNEWTGTTLRFELAE